MHLNSENFIKKRNKLFVLSFLLWLIPFCARIPMNISYDSLPVLNDMSNSPLSILYTALKNSDSDEALSLSTFTISKYLYINE